MLWDSRQVWPLCEAHWLWSRLSWEAQRWAIRLARRGERTVGRRGPPPAAPKKSRSFSCIFDGGLEIPSLTYCTRTLHEIIPTSFTFPAHIHTRLDSVHAIHYKPRSRFRRGQRWYSGSAKEPFPVSTFRWNNNSFEDQALSRSPYRSNDGCPIRRTTREERPDHGSRADP